MSEMRVVHPAERDKTTAATAGMQREEGIGASTVGASGIWSGHVTMAPGMKSGAHHHGDVESAIYIISGKARFRYGEHLEKTLEASAGDFIYVPPMLVHQEMNASDSEPVVAVVSRGSQENVVVNVDLPEVKEA